MSGWSYAKRVLAITTTCAESGLLLAFFVDQIAVVREGKTDRTARIVMSNGLEYTVEEPFMDVLDRIAGKELPTSAATTPGEG